jgi:hypothetical protein
MDGIFIAGYTRKPLLVNQRKFSTAGLQAFTFQATDEPDLTLIQSGFG